MARVPYLRREDADESQKALYDRLEAERKVPTANIFLALANAPAQLDGFLTYANSLRASALSPALRELAILTVGHVTRSAYEVAHHHSHGVQARLTEEQIAAVGDFESSELFDQTEKAVMRLARESTLRVDVSEETWRAAAELLPRQQMVELALSIAWYNSGVRIMGLLEIDLEDNYPDPFPNS
ncbi:carboxymuconolactone decarboxylase family protein [Streptomyces blattellae]|uniref:carboxymuconolactone decarboxylase family protein n=1 Tax=Streptomyces blattellae TaxID=2569855 RepID=UPI0012B77DA7|nr:carboxymuconolactone decarboxylase family protein [Streptomyces blattellae]